MVLVKLGSGACVGVLGVGFRDGAYVGSLSGWFGWAMVEHALMDVAGKRAIVSMDDEQVAVCDEALIGAFSDSNVAPEECEPVEVEGDFILPPLVLLDWSLTPIAPVCVIDMTGILIWLLCTRLGLDTS